MDELLSIKQAAGFLACSEALLRKWVSRRAIPRVKVGRLTRLRRSDLESWMRHGISPDQGSRWARVHTDRGNA